MGEELRAKLERPQNERMGVIRVRSTTFSREGDLERLAGNLLKGIIEAFG
jgi:hypothetical protein